jgi:hypothetical protein
MRHINCTNKLTLEEEKTKAIIKQIAKKAKLRC